jgi:hypothetical protein
VSVIVSVCVDEEAISLLPKQNLHLYPSIFYVYIKQSISLQCFCSYASPLLHVS